jgi:predicted ATP-grasp superfamily ATP-dependent carboligase
VYALGPVSAPIRNSRFSRWIPLRQNGNPQQEWLEWLMGDAAAALQGAVLLPCADEGVELTARNRVQLATRFRLIEGKDEILLAMLDKSATYAWASRVGVSAPAACPARSLADALAIGEQIGYPFVLKPRYSHLFQRFFTTKVFVITSREHLCSVFKQVEPHGLEMLVTEIIHGENQFCSYYTYLDEQLEPLFHFTKRKLRQSPNGLGIGTYHISDWNPEVAQLGLQFLRGVGLAGFGNVEFKRDSRDNRLKLIECNPRFTLPHEMLQICGIDVSLLVYNRLTGRPLPSVGEYRRGVRVLLPLDDLSAFREAHGRGELSWTQWLGSLLHRQHFLYFRWSDPWPATMRVWSYVREQFLRRVWSLLTRCRSVMPRGVGDGYYRA